MRKSDIIMYIEAMENANKNQNDSSLFPVKRFVALLGLAGFENPVKEAKRVHDYILKNKEIHGCYISGSSDDPWDEDYFVLSMQHVSY